MTRLAIRYLGHGRRAFLWLVQSVRSLVCNIYQFEVRQCSARFHWLTSHLVAGRRLDEWLLRIQIWIPVGFDRCNGIAELLHLCDLFRKGCRNACCWSSSLRVVLGRIRDSEPCLWYVDTPLLSCLKLTISFYSASEVCPTNLRGYMTTYVNLCWAIGQLIAAGVLRGCLGIEGAMGYKIPFALQWVSD